MRKLLIAIAIFVSQVGVMNAGEPDKALHNKCIYPTVMLEGTNPLYGGNGTGVIVKSIKKDDKYINYVFTCAHVLAQTPPRIVMPKEGSNDIPKLIPQKYEYQVKIGVYEDWSRLVAIDVYNCEVLCVNQGYSTDTALIRFFSDKEMPVADICEDPKVYIGNQVCRVGCGLNEPFRVDFGKVNSVVKSILDRQSAATKNTYRISALTLPGDSGGPVFDDEHKLFGLAQLIRGFNMTPENHLPVFHMAYVLPIERFTKDEVIVSYLDGKEPKKSLLEIIHEAADSRNSD